MPGNGMAAARQLVLPARQSSVEDDLRALEFYTAQWRRMSRADRLLCLDALTARYGADTPIVERMGRETR